MYPIIIVPDEAGDILEQLGTKPKFWFSDANSSRYLFKLNRSEGEDATGEDWSEKVASELCKLLALPHARYEFAIWKGQHGVASLSFAPPRGRLVAGNEILVQLDKAYPKERFYRLRQHTLRLVLAIIKQDVIQPPLGWTPVGNIRSALDGFVGYLLLGKPMTTLNVFSEAARLHPVAAKAWLERLAEISENDITEIFDQIPNDRISNAARRFAMKMLELNQKRLLKSEV